VRFNVKVVEPPVVLFKYLDDARTFSPIIAQSSGARLREFLDLRLDFDRKLHFVIRVGLWSRGRYLFRKIRKVFQFFLEFETEERY
jgi:hypothetical protein